jgi:endonuclease YncB( thermonuclease family)
LTTRSIATAIALSVLAAACATSDEPTGANVLDGPGSPQTVITCSECPVEDVVDVIDGDTIVGASGKVRMYGIDAPEIGERCYSEAKATLTRLAGDQARTQSGPRPTGEFGRRLAYLFDIKGNSLDVQLIAEGVARAWTRDGQHRDVLVGLEASALSNQAGCLWNGEADQ